MRNEAYKLTGFTVVASAVGFLLRWLQNLRIIDPETGLATRGMGISVLVVLLILLTAGVIGAACFMLRRCTAPTEPERALTGKTFLYTAISFMPVLMLAIAGIVQLGQANAAFFPETQVPMRRLSAIGTLAGAFGAAMLVSGIGKKERETTVRVGVGLLILFGGLWLIALYKSAAADPVLWRFAIEVLAVCAALMAIYYVAGYFFGEPSPMLTVFFCHTGGFLCLMSVIDEHTVGESVCYAAVALMLLTWGFDLVANLRDETPVIRESGAGNGEKHPI